MKSIERQECLWLAGAVVFGAIVRLWYPGRMAIEHFDEGVYASNFWFGGMPYPSQHLYAPPLLPNLIEWSMITASLCGLKPTGFVPMIPSLVAGIATIPSIWWICRRWFGAAAGLTSAWLVATSDFHASYSRAALTDVLLCLFILWAVYFIERALTKATTPPTNVVERGKSKQAARRNLPWREIILGGVFTGLAWWTKYNGWLPLAIGIAGGVYWQILTPSPERQVRRILICLGLIVIIAGVIWSPVLWELQQPDAAGNFKGGYAAVAANHRQYLVGVKGWIHSIWVQMYNVGIYENPFEIFYAPFPHLHTLQREQRLDFQELKGDLQGGTWQSKLALFHAVLFEDILPFFIPILLLALSLWVCLRSMLVKPTPTRLLAMCLMAAWFAGLTIATPFYHPYPRLVLPLLCSAWICVGLYLARESDEHDQSRISAVNKKRLQILVGILVTVTLIRLMCGSANSWKDRAWLQRLAKGYATGIRKEISLHGSSERESQTIVIGEPAMVFGLLAEGLPNVYAGQNLDFVQGAIPRVTFVVLSRQYFSTISQEERDRLYARSKVLAESKFRPSHVVRNDTWNAQWRLEEPRLFRLPK